MTQNVPRALYDRLIKDLTDEAWRQAMFKSFSVWDRGDPRKVVLGFKPLEARGVDQDVGPVTSQPRTAAVPNSDSQAFTTTLTFRDHTPYFPHLELSFEATWIDASGGKHASTRTYFNLNASNIRGNVRG
ncbi:hypothetical protein ANO11243_039890 [Dothideomycetidae sp. 11243]|nr:hypothetical protein ANO11243_039890 [fungal sp. No.11243]